MIKRGNPNWCLNGCVDYYNLGKTEGILRACDYKMDEPQNSGLTVFFLTKTGMNICSRGLNVNLGYQ